MKMFRVVVNGNEYKVGIEELTEVPAIKVPATQAPVIQAAVSTPVATPKTTAPQPAAKPDPAPAKTESAVAGGTIAAPMPGTILQVAVEKGDKVAKGQTLLVLEAMKMENEIMAPANGVVEEVNVSQGASVNAGQSLIVLSLE